jgi:GDP-L-fucose synthase
MDNDKFEIWGTGNPLREFLYVYDLADCIKFIIDSDLNEDLLNIGSGEEISIKNLATLIAELLNYKGDLVFNTNMPDGNPRKLLDTTKLNELGWKNSTNLITGLEKTIDWFKLNQ